MTFQHSARILSASWGWVLPQRKNCFCLSSPEKSFPGFPEGPWAGSGFQPISNAWSSPMESSETHRKLDKQLYGKQGPTWPLPLTDATLLLRCFPFHPSNTATLQTWDILSLPCSESPEKVKGESLSCLPFLCHHQEGWNRHVVLISFATFFHSSYSNFSSQQREIIFVNVT